VGLGALAASKEVEILRGVPESGTRIDR